MRILVSAALLATFLAGQAPKVKHPPEVAAPGFDSITVADCQKWLTLLASDDFEGRDTATAGFQKAADMVAAHFKAIGLKPIADKDAEGKPTYFQNVPFVAPGLDAEQARFEVTGGKAPITAKPGEGFGATGLGTLHAKGAVTFVIAQNGSRIADFDVAGKVVIVVAYDAEGNPASPQAHITSELRKSGAATVIRINDVYAARGMGTTKAVRKDHFHPSPEKTPTVSISRAVADAIAAAADLEIAGLIAKSKAAGAPQSVPTQLSASVDVASKVAEIAVPNVVGFLEGSDPVLKNELLIIGSHLDHLGRETSTGKVFNGADDDGSGTTGLLAVSRAFTKNPRAPKRSVLFLAFCGEELGLLGSDWYVEHALFPHATVIAELQMDMIGRSEEAHDSENPGNETAEENVNTLHLIGAKRIAPGLQDLIVKLNADYVGFDFEYDQESVYTRSDHANFAKKGIPIAFFFTGFHRDYHKTTDDVEKIDFPKLVRVAQLVYLTGWELGERAEKFPGKRPREGR